jgi:two-component system, OmpR family, response regulator MprA
VSGTQRPDYLADYREPRVVNTPILVVEDDPQLRAIFQLLFEGEGYPVVTAADGLEALRVARTMRPSLVILDLALPLLDGHAVGTQLRATYGDALPIVVVTATGQTAETVDDIASCGYLSKPFDIDDLIAAVRHCLGPSGLR